jgi:hypothetical protein
MVKKLVSLGLALLTVITCASTALANGTKNVPVSDVTQAQTVDAQNQAIANRDLQMALDEFHAAQKAGDRDRMVEVYKKLRGDAEVQVRDITTRLILMSIYLRLFLEQALAWLRLILYENVIRALRDNVIIIADEIERLAGIVTTWSQFRDQMTNFLQNSGDSVLRNVARTLSWGLEQMGRYFRF